MSSVISFIIQTYDEWKTRETISSFTSNDISWIFSSNVLGDNITVSSSDGSNKHRFIIQNRSILLSVLKEYFQNLKSILL